MKTLPHLLLQLTDLHSADNEFGILLEILEENREIVVLDNAEVWEDDDKQPSITPGEIFKVPGSLVAMVERLDDDLTRSLQHIDPHAAEYIDRLTDEQTLYNKILRTMLYIESLSSMEKLELPQENMNRVVIRRVEHLYFKVILSLLVPTTLFANFMLARTSC